jgi:hypothetical protein
MTFSTLPISFDEGLIMHSCFPTVAAFFMVDMASFNGSLCILSPHEYFLNPICGAISRKHWRQRCMPYRRTMPRFLPQRTQPFFLPNSFFGFTRPPRH